jgi:repressor LexA
VVARLNGEVTVKRLDRSQKTLRLLAENIDFDPIVITPEAEFFIEGHAVGVIRTAL